MRLLGVKRYGVELNATIQATGKLGFSMAASDILHFGERQYWQLCGLNVVPTATYGDVNSFKWCYEGLPKGSILAVGNETVHMSLRSSVTLWQWSIRELEEQKRPTMLLVYGKRIEVPGIQTPIQYIDGYINKYFRNGKNNQ